MLQITFAEYWLSNSSCFTAFLWPQNVCDRDVSLQYMLHLDKFRYVCRLSSWMAVQRALAVVSRLNDNCKYFETGAYTADVRYLFRSVSSQWWNWSQQWRVHPFVQSVSETYYLILRQIFSDTFMQAPAQCNNHSSQEKGVWKDTNFLCLFLFSFLVLFFLSSEICK